MIDSATDTTTGQVGWDGENGIESILSELNLAIRNNGIVFYPDTSALALAGLIDSGYACCINSSLLAFYKWFAEVDEAYPNAITSSAGGQWRPFFATAAPVESPWVINSDNDIVPNTDYLDSGVGIGKATVPNKLWVDSPDKDSTNQMKGWRISPMSSAVMNSEVAPEDWTLITNTSSRMMLIQHPGVGFKSASVYAGSVANGTVTGSAITITIPDQFVNSYKVYITATDATTGGACGGGYYISSKLTNSFTITFIAFASGAVNLDYQISH